MSRSEIPRLGVIGCGWIMREMYTPALEALAGRVRVTAVCDLDPALAAGTAVRFPGASVYGDAGAMLREARPEAVLVLTSEKANARMARLALEAGAAVYLEKPPAVNARELEELIAAEARGRAPIYPAFNRRHTPLFAGFDRTGKKWSRVSGAMKRRGRKVETFPFTAIHLIDAAQWFAGSALEQWEVTFTRADGAARWRIEGRLQSGAACALEMAPDGPEQAEFLVLESGTETWELQFPNAAVAVPEGEIIRRAGNEPPAVTRGEAGPAFAAMGFRSCLLDFLTTAGGESEHRLAFCRATIAVMEEMQARAG